MDACDIVRSFVFSNDRISVYPRITSKAAEGAISKYAEDVDPDDILFLLDESMLCNGKEGVLLTRDRVLSKFMLQDASEFQLANIRSVEAKRKKIFINNQEFADLYFVSGEECGRIAELIARVAELARKDGRQKSGVAEAAAPRTTESAARSIDVDRLLGRNLFYLYGNKLRGSILKFAAVNTIGTFVERALAEKWEPDRRSPFDENAEYKAFTTATCNFIDLAISAHKLPLQAGDGVGVELFLQTKATFELLVFIMGRTQHMLYSNLSDKEAQNFMAGLTAEIFLKHFVQLYADYEIGRMPAASLGDLGRRKGVMNIVLKEMKFKLNFYSRDYPDFPLIFLYAPLGETEFTDCMRKEYFHCDTYLETFVAEADEKIEAILMELIS